MELTENPKRFGATDGCNLVSGAYRFNGACNIQFDSIRTTLIFCLDSVIRTQADAISGILANTRTYEVTDDQLTLCTPDKRRLIYKKK
jgi:heat shock protein HslJ